MRTLHPKTPEQPFGALALPYSSQCSFGQWHRCSKTYPIWPTVVPPGIGGNCPSALPWAFFALGFFTVCTKSPFGGSSSTPNGPNPALQRSNSHPTGVQNLMLQRYSATALQHQALARRPLCAWRARVDLLQALPEAKVSLAALRIHG